jgi:hypothetical protein
MEMQIQKQKDVMKNKLPEIEKAVETLNMFMIEKDADYEVKKLNLDRLLSG